MPYAIGIDNGKIPFNLGTLMRGAYNFDADLIFTVGNRYKRQISDTVNARNHIPILHFQTWEDYKKVGLNWIHVGIELFDKSDNIKTFVHPKQAVYLLGPEDGSLSKEAQDICKYFLKIPTKHCLNQAQAGTIVMYDRILKEK